MIARHSHATGGRAVASGPQLPDQPVTGGNELGQGKPVEPCHRGVEVLSRCRLPIAVLKLPRIQLTAAAPPRPVSTQWLAGG